MESATQLANRCREVLLDGKWIANTNFKDQLSAVTWEQATTRIGSLNTLAALAFHINYYLDGILNVFKGGSLDIRDKFSFDLKNLESAQDWQNLLNSMSRNAEAFCEHVQRMSDEKLDSHFTHEKYGTYRRSIEGVIEHGYYHLGQISLIKKMVLEADQNSSNAIAFYKTAYEGNPRKAVDLYVGSEYIQHNPLVGNGAEPFIEYFERMEAEYPDKSIEFVRSSAQGDLVALHTHQVWPGNEEYVTMDFFRFDATGKIVEHWDAMQQIPEHSANGNTMY
jgi:predicted SnoaL-like aldol condensation-catalyzing enzyme/uncharacterized damage-inducible protein DinB